MPAKLMVARKVNALWLRTEAEAEALSFLKSHASLECDPGGTGSFRSAHLVSVEGRLICGRFAASRDLKLFAPRKAQRIVIAAVETGTVSIGPGHSGLVEAGSSGAIVADCRYPDPAVVTASGDFYLATLEIQDLHQRLAELTGGPLRHPINFSGQVSEAVSMTDALLPLMQALCRFALDANRAGAFKGAMESMHRALVDLCISAFQNNYSELLERDRGADLYPRYVRRAVEFMRRNVGRAITIDEVAQAAATSKRSLQLGFKRFIGASPAAYLRELRLEGARADLMNPHKAPSIAEIASAWGFSHLGLFARYYRQAFGELPSATLSRRPS